MAGPASAFSLPLGAELLPQQPTGQAPWERQSAALPAPDDPESRARAEKWTKAAAEQGNTDNGANSANAGISREEARRRRAAEKKARKEQAEAEQEKKLEDNARRMYLAGFFALPLLWLVSMFYFHKEHKSADANPVIRKYYKNSRFMLMVYTAIMVAWFVVFQVHSESSLKVMNIIYFKGRSPSGF